MTSSSEGIESTGLIAALLLICVVAVLGNIVVILVIVLKCDFRGVTEVFLGNLAVSDMLLAGIALPLKVNQALASNHNYIGGDARCKAVMFLPKFTIMSSVSTMVALSFERYFAIVRQRSLPMRKTPLVIVVTWLVALAFSAPQLYEYSVYEKWEEEHNETEISCGSHGTPKNFETVYAAIVVFLGFCLPLVVISINYINIGRFLWQAGTQVQGAVNKQRTRIVQMLVVVTAVFALLWMPYFVLFTKEEVTGTDDSAEAGSAAHAMKIFMVALSTLSNLVVYAIFNRKFRVGALMVLTCGKARDNSVSSVAA